MKISIMKSFRSEAEAKSKIGDPALNIRWQRIMGPMSILIVKVRLTMHVDQSYTS